MPKDKKFRDEVLMGHLANHFLQVTVGFSKQYLGRDLTRGEFEFLDHLTWTLAADAFVPTGTQK